jgi:hypothetical protein
MFMKKLRAMKIRAANWYVGARIIDPSKTADALCVPRTLLGLPQILVSLGIIGTTTMEVISAAPNQGPSIVSDVPYTLLNQSESNMTAPATPEAKPTKPRVTENFMI